MKFIIVAVFMAIYLAVGIHSESVTYSISNETLTVHSTADVHLNISIEGVWDSLSKGKSRFCHLRCTQSLLKTVALEITAHYYIFTLAVHRYPTINSGDTIALRSAYTSGSFSKYWLYCHTSYCYWTSCQGTIITSSGWTSCSTRMMFTITAKGKIDGEPINSGDTVSLRSNAYGSSYRLYCTSSSSTNCYIRA